MKKLLFILPLFLLPVVCLLAQTNPADKVQYFQAGDEKYYKEDVVVPKVSDPVDADYRDAVDVGGGTKGTKVNKPKTVAVVQPQRYPTNVPVNNANEVQLKGGQKVVTPHNSSPKVKLKQGKPMPMIGQTQDTQNLQHITKPVEQKTVTPAPVKAQTPTEQKNTANQVKQVTPQQVQQAAPVKASVPTQEYKAKTAPVKEEKYAAPKKVHLKDYEVEIVCNKGDTKCEAEQARIKAHNEATLQKQTGQLQAPEKAKISKPKVTSSPAPIGGISHVPATPTGNTGVYIKENGVIIPEKPLKYGIKTKCVPLPGQTTCEEKPVNKLAGYKPSNGVNLPEATLPEGMQPVEDTQIPQNTPAKKTKNTKKKGNKASKADKVNNIDTPKRIDFHTDVNITNKEARKNLLEGYSVTANSNIKIPKASLPTEVELDAQDARVRAEIAAQQQATEMAYQKALDDAKKFKAQAQAAKNQFQQQQQQQKNAANQFCSYMGVRFSGTTCQYCVNHKPRSAMECNQCCQSFGRPLMQPASYSAFSSGGRPAGCLCRFSATSGYNF